MSKTADVEHKNLIKVIEQIEKTNEFFCIALHGYAHDSSFEYQKHLDVESIFYDGETWVVYTTKNEEYKLSEYGVKWKLLLDPDYDYEYMEAYELSKEEYDDLFGDY